MLAMPPELQQTSDAEGGEDADHTEDASNDESEQGIPTHLVLALLHAVGAAVASIIAVAVGH